MSDEPATRIAVVGASAGLGRCIGIGLARRGARVAFLARRQDRLVKAAEEAQNGAVAVTCDVTDAITCRRAIGRVVDEFGGLDALVYTTGMGVLAPLADVTSEQWAQLFATNVTGASLVTAAAAPHLAATGGSAVYLSSLSASYTTPWPLLGAYAVSKAALDKLTEAWRIEHPNIAFTRLAVGDSFGVRATRRPSSTRVGIRRRWTTRSGTGWTTVTCRAGWSTLIISSASCTRYSPAAAAVSFPTSRSRRGPPMRSRNSASGDRPGERHASSPEPCAREGDSQ